MLPNCDMCSKHGECTLEDEEECIAEGKNIQDERSEDRELRYED